MIRDGKIVVDECPECGCRLNDNQKHFDSTDLMMFYDQADLYNQLTQGLLLRDAKGCICSTYTEEVFLDG